MFGNYRIKGLFVVTLNVNKDNEIREFKIIAKQIKILTFEYTEYYYLYREVFSNLRYLDVKK